jgi:hypothetical protein
MSVAQSRYRFDTFWLSSGVIYSQQLRRPMVVRVLQRAIGVNRQDAICARLDSVDAAVRQRRRACWAWKLRAS